MVLYTKTLFSIKSGFDHDFIYASLNGKADPAYIIQELNSVLLHFLSIVRHINDRAIIRNNI